MLLETIQLLTLTGSCDIDDLILNLTGAILAFGFIKLISLQKLFE
jgi:glycopeptide antibiotics resistance protein